MCIAVQAVHVHGSRKERVLVLCLSERLQGPASGMME